MTTEEMQNTLTGVITGLSLLKDRMDQSQTRMDQFEQQRRAHEESSQRWQEQFEQQLQLSQTRMDQIALQVQSLSESSRTYLQSLEILGNALQTQADQFDLLHASLKQLSAAQKHTDTILEKIAAAQFQSDERLTRLEESIHQLTLTVDRYLSARLNGGSQN
jgi:chromosome segregation ATPase